MPRLITPLSKEYRITGSEEIDIGLSDDDPIVVSFVAATTSNNHQRTEMLDVSIERVFAQNDDVREKIQTPSFDYQRAVEVYLTMTSCNIEDEAGSPLFKFRTLNGKVSLSDNFETFFKTWGKLNPQWALAIHSVCLAVNPFWGEPAYPENSVFFERESLPEVSGVSEEIA